MHVPSQLRAARLWGCSGEGCKQLLLVVLPILCSLPLNAHLLHCRPLATVFGMYLVYLTNLIPRTQPISSVLASYPAHLLCTSLVPSPSPLYWPRTQPISSVLASYTAHLLCTGLVPSPSPLYWPRTQPISSVLASYPAHLLCTSLVPSPSPLYWPRTQPISSVLASYPAHLLCTGLVPSPSPLY